MINEAMYWISYLVAFVISVIVVYYLDKRHKRNLGKGLLHVPLLSVLLGMAIANLTSYALKSQITSPIVVVALHIIIPILMTLTLSYHWIIKGNPVLGPKDYWR